MGSDGIWEVKFQYLIAKTDQLLSHHFRGSDLASTHTDDDDNEDRILGCLK